jgi:hypothetical protein
MFSGVDLADDARRSKCALRARIEALLWQVAAVILNYGELCDSAIRTDTAQMRVDGKDKLGRAGRRRE